MKKRFDTKKVNKKPWAVVGNVVVNVVSVITVMVAAVGVWRGGMLSLCALLLILAVFAVIIRREMKKSMQAALETQRIEAEKRAMELKLQENQISIMLSQIQPHFLYNTLNSIYQLCETNPMRARSMVNSFAEYLRNNLSSLEEPGLILFETELENIFLFGPGSNVESRSFFQIVVLIKHQCRDFFPPFEFQSPRSQCAVWR